MSLKDDLIADEENSQAVEADEDVTYTPTPDEDSGVVATEPPIITIGRSKQKNALRAMQQEQGNS